MVSTLGFRLSTPPQNANETRSFHDADVHSLAGWSTIAPTKMALIEERMKITRRGVLGAMGLAGLAAIGVKGAAGAQETPKRITIGKPYELRTMDPHSSTDQTAWAIQAVVSASRTSRAL